MRAGSAGILRGVWLRKTVRGIFKYTMPWRDYQPGAKAVAHRSRLGRACLAWAIDISRASRLPGGPLLPAGHPESIRTTILKRVLAVIPTHERPEEIKELLNSLAKLRTDSCAFSVSVMDDGSLTSLEDIVRSEGLGLDLIFSRNEKSHGPSWCRNRMVEATDSDYLWFLDSDTVVLSPDTLENMLIAIGRDPKICAVGGTVENIDGDLLLQQLEILPNAFFLYRVFGLDDFEPSYVEGFGTCNMLVTREAFNRTGGFDESLPRDEDMDFCLTLRGLGCRFYMEKGTSVLHKCSHTGRSTGAFAFHMSRIAYFQKLLETRVTIIERHFPVLLLALPLLDLLLIPRVMYRVSSKYYAHKRIRRDVLTWSYSSLVTGGHLLYILAKCYAVGYLRLALRALGQRRP